MSPLDSALLLAAGAAVAWGAAYLLYLFIDRLMAAQHGR